MALAEIGGQTFSITGSPLSFISLEEDWYEDLTDPASVITTLTQWKHPPDILTFRQRVPEVDPKYDYPKAWESLAVLPIATYDRWWHTQIKATTRNMVRKSQKAGLEVRKAAFDDDFVRGMVDIFNEAPVRQGRRFWHYGKDFATVKGEFSRFLFREDLIGAYYGNELVGFAMLANAGRFGLIGQFIAKIRHRDKATSNALMAKTVEVCASRQLPYLVYTTWRDTSLVDFKRHSGFREMKLPRYFVPLTARGTLAMTLGFQRFHAGLREGLPSTLRNSLKTLRRHWYSLRRH